MTNHSARLFLDRSKIEKLISWAITTTSLLLANWSAAAVLGEVTVMTYAGQPLHAEVEIYDIAENELGNLRAGLASLRAFADAESELTPLMRELKITLHQENKRVFVHIDSLRPISEPIIGMLLELKVGKQSKFREYAMIPEDASAATRVAEPSPQAAKSLPQPKNVTPVAAATNNYSKNSPSELNKTAPANIAAPDNRSILLPDAVFTRVEETKEPGIGAALRHTPKTEDSEVTLIRQTRERPAFANESIDLIIPKEVTATREPIPDTKIDLRRAIKPESIKSDITQPEIISAPRQAAAPEIDASGKTEQFQETKVLTSPPLRKLEPEVKKVSSIRSNPIPTPSENRSISGQIKPAAPEPQIQRQDRLKLSTAIRPDEIETIKIANKATHEEEIIAAKKSAEESAERIRLLEKNISAMKQMIAARSEPTQPPTLAALPYGSVTEGLPSAIRRDEAATEPAIDDSNTTSNSGAASQANNQLAGPTIESHVSATSKPDHPGTWGIFQLSLASLLCGVIAFTVMMRINPNS